MRFPISRQVSSVTTFGVTKLISLLSWLLVFGRFSFSFTFVLNVSSRRLPNVSFAYYTLPLYISHSYKGQWNNLYFQLFGNFHNEYAVSFPGVKLIRFLFIDPFINFCIFSFNSCALLFNMNLSSETVFCCCLLFILFFPLSSLISLLIN